MPPRSATLPGGRLAARQGKYEVGRRFFLLLVLVGLLPTILNSVWLLRGVPGGVMSEQIAWILGGAAIALMLIAALSSRWLSRALGADLTRFRSALRRMANGDYRIWVRHGGVTRESRELGTALNRLAGNVAEDSDHLQREQEESKVFAEQSLEFIEELLRARVPLAKHHPGLVESFGRELVERKKLSASIPESQNFVRGVMDAVLGKETRLSIRRSDPRYRTSMLWIESPVPGRITDLSARGMCIECLDTPQGRDPRPFTIANGQERFGIPARVEWCKLVATQRTESGESLAVYRAGVSFIDELPSALHDKLMKTLELQLAAGR